jgi:putative transposase
LICLRESTRCSIQNRTGCQWAFPPHDLLPKSTVYDYFTKYRDHGVWPQIVDALRVEVRHSTPQAPGKEGMREPTPSAVCVDSSTVTLFTHRAGRAVGETSR